MKRAVWRIRRGADAAYRTSGATTQRRWQRARAACAALLALAAAACTDLFVEPAPPEAVPIALSLVMPTAAAGGPAEAFAKADGAHVRITRGGSNGAVVLDTVLAFTPAAGEVRIRAEVEVEEGGAEYTVAVTLLGGSAALFQGAGTVTVRTGAASAVEIALEPVAVQLSVRQSYPELTAYGETLQLEGVALFATGDEVGEPLEWSSLDPEVLEVTTDGLATARGDGTARVRAVFAGLAAQVEVSVRARVASVEVVPSSFELRQDSVRTLEAVLRDANGNVITAPRTVTWESSAPGVASVTREGGVVQGRIPGKAVITAASEGAEGTATVTVLPPKVVHVQVVPSQIEMPVGQSIQLTALAFDALGRPVADVEATWTSTAPEVASIVATGAFTAVAEALAEGTTSIIATIDGVSGEARMTVLSLIVVTIDPPEVVLGVEEFLQLTAHVSGTDDQRVTWHSSQPEVVWVSEDGMIVHVGGCEPAFVTIVATSVAYPYASGFATVYFPGCEGPPPPSPKTPPPAR